MGLAPRVMLMLACGLCRAEETEELCAADSVCSQADGDHTSLIQNFAKVNILMREGEGVPGLSVVKVQGDRYCNSPGVKLSVARDASAADCANAVSEAFGKSMTSGERYFCYYEKQRRFDAYCEVEITQNDCGGSDSLKRIPTGYDFYRIRLNNPREESEEMIFAKLMQDVYNDSPPSGSIDGWEWRLNAVNKGDKMRIFQKGKRCAVGFSGSDDLMDWAANVNIQRDTSCGFDFHKGFVSELRRYLAASEWASFDSFLSSAECEDGVATYGHSLGGALAASMAGCANSDDQSNLGINGIAFKASHVYTYGGARTSKETAVYNKQAADGCFQGGRFFNYDGDAMAREGITSGADFDPVPNLLDDYGFQHPKLMAVQLKLDGDGLHRIESPCGSEAAYKAPRRGMLGSVLNVKVYDHSGSTYQARLEYLKA